MLISPRIIPILLVMTLALLNLSAAAQTSSSIEPPNYSLGDRWEYLVNGQLASLAGFSGFPATIQIRGPVAAEVASTEGESTNLSWRGDLTLEGALSIPFMEGSPEAELSGGIALSREEQYEVPYFLPLSIQSTADFSIQITNFCPPAKCSASLELLANQTPGVSFPIYPLEEGDREVVILSQVETRVSFSFDGFQLENVSARELESVLLMNVTAGHEVDVPAGSFQALKVTTHVAEGMAFGFFQELFPGTRQVAYYSNEVGNAVLLQFFSNDTEVGNITLQSYYIGSARPIWQHPALIGGLLVVPAAILLYLSWRERRKGL